MLASALVPTGHGLNGPEGIVISGTDIFVANYSNQTLMEYDTSGNTLANPLASGGALSSGPIGIVAIPEPSTWAMMGIGAGLLIFRRQRRLRRE